MKAQYQYSREHPHAVAESSIQLRILARDTLYDQNIFALAQIRHKTAPEACPFNQRGSSSEVPAEQGREEEEGGGSCTINK